MRHPPRHRRGLTWTALGSLFLACHHPAPRPSSTAPCGTSIEDVAWISGRWRATRAEAVIEEHWTPPAGSSLLGVGRVIAGGKTAFFEYLRIESRPEGLYYVAHPKARPGVEFKLVRCQEGEALFENPAHDHPQRILYRKGTDGSLTTRVEGVQEGKALAEEVVLHPL